MKWFIVAILVLVHGLYRCAAVDPRYADGETLAREFLTNPAVVYEGNFSALRWEGSRWIPIHANFRFAAEQPFPWIAVPREGYALFHLWIQGINAGGEQISSGEFFDSQLNRGDSYMVYLYRVNNIHVPSQVDSHQLYERGFLSHVPEAVPMSYAILDLRLADSIKDATLGEDNHARFNDQQFDTAVIRYGSAVNGKVYIVPDLNQCWLYVWLSGVSGARVEVRDSSGTIVPVTITDYGYGLEVSAAPMEKAIVTVLPGTTYNIGRQFFIDIARER